MNELEGLHAHNAGRFDRPVRSGQSKQHDTSALRAFDQLLQLDQSHIHHAGGLDRSVRSGRSTQRVPLLLPVLKRAMSRIGLEQDGMMNIGAGRSHAQRHKHACMN